MNEPNKIGIDITADDSQYVAATQRSAAATEQYSATVVRLQDAAARAVAGLNPMNAELAAMPPIVEEGTRAVIGMGPAVTGLTAAALILAKAWHDGSEETKAFNLALDSTSNYAGMTAGSMHDLAAQVSALGNITVNQAKSIVQAYVNTGQIGGQALQTLARLTENYAVVTGQEVDKVAPKLASMFEDPARAAETLNKQMHFLSVTEMEHIRTLQQNNDLTQAQLYLGEKLETHLGNVAPRLGAIQHAWKGIQQAASSAWDVMMGIGRPDTAEEKFSRIKARLEGMAAQYGVTIDQLRAKVKGTVLEESVGKDLEEYDQAKAADGRARALTAAQAAAAEANRKAQEAMAIINKNANSSKVEGIQAELNKVLAFTPENADQAAKKTEAIKKLLEEYDKAKFGKKGKPDYSHEDEMARLQKMAEAESKAIEKQNEAYAKAVEHAIGPLEKEAEHLERQRDLQERSRAEIERSIIARLEEARAIAESNGAFPEHLQFLDREIEARRRIAEASAGIEADKQAKAAARKQEEEWKRTSDNISRSLADAMMRGFDKGHNAGKVALDALKHAFATAVLEPRIKAIVDPMAKATGALMDGVFKQAGSFLGNLFSSWHTGGVPGDDPARYTHAVPANVFANAPRYHGSGIAGDELATVLKRGEGVFTEGQMRRLAPVGEASPNININIVNAPSQPKVEATRNGNGFDIAVVFEKFDSMLAGNLSSGRGPTAGVLKSGFGLGMVPGG